MLTKIKNITLYKPISTSKNAQHKHTESAHKDEHEDYHEDDLVNAHLWLAIDNMQIFAEALVEKLIQIDKKNAHTYQANLTRLSQQLSQLKEKTWAQLKPYQSVPIATYSNAVEYFQQSNQLQTPVLLTKFHGERLSLGRLLQVKKTMQMNNTHCLIATTQVQKNKLSTIAEGLNINAVRVDILGANISQGTDYYQQLIHRLTNQVVQCLQ